MKHLFIALVVLAAFSCSNDKASNIIHQTDPFPAILGNKDVIREIGLYADRNAEYLESEPYPSIVYLEVAQDSVRASITVYSLSSMTEFENNQPCALKSISNHYVLVKYNNCLNTISPTQRQWINRHLINDRKRIVNSSGDTVTLQLNIFSHPEEMILFIRDGKVIHKTSEQSG